MPGGSEVYVSAFRVSESGFNFETQGHPGFRGKHPQEDPVSNNFFSNTIILMNTIYLTVSVKKSIFIGNTHHNVILATQSL